MEKILFISPSTPDKTNWVMSLGTITFCTLFLGWLAYRFPVTFLIMVITIVFCWGAFVLQYISLPHKFILTNSHFIIKRFLKDSAIPLQNIKYIRPITKKQLYSKYGVFYSFGSFGSYPSKQESLIAYNIRWDNWVLLITDRGKFLISPNDMQLIDATIQQIEKVKGGDAYSEIMLPHSTQWFKFISIAIVASVILLLYMGYRQPRVVFDSDAFKLKGIFGVNIPLADITKADTIAWREMPAISIRTGGISLFKVNRGRFRTADGEKVRLNIHRGVSPVIRLVDNDGITYYINRKNVAETREIFNKIKTNQE